MVISGEYPLAPTKNRQVAPKFLAWDVAHPEFAAGERRVGA